MGRPTSSSARRPLTILVVDDLEANRKLLRLQFMAAGHRVVVAADGLAALRALQRKPIDAIISDILMPEMDGYQLCIRVRSHPQFARLPFIYYSATFTSRRAQQYARTLGADGFFQRPFDIQQLIQAIWTAQRRRRHARPRKKANVEALVRKHAEQLAMKLEEKNAQLERKQADLQSREELLRALIETAAELILLTDLDGHILTANAAVQAMTGRSLNELQAMKFVDLVPEGDRQGIRDTISLLASPHEGVRYLEMPIGVPNGRVRWIGLNARHRIAEGRPVGWYLIARDITELRNAEHELMESERRYRLLFDANPLPMWVFDLETLRFLAVNETVVKTYGYSREELLNMTIADIRPPEDLPQLRNALAMDRTKIGSLGTARHRRKDGSIVTVEITGHDISFDGRRARLILANDITERLVLQEELQARERRLTSFFTGAAAGLAIWDTELRYVLINETLAEINGWTVAEHLGRPVVEILPEIAEVIEPILRSVLDTGEPMLNVDVSGPTRKAPGVVRHWNASYFPIRGRDERVEGIGGIIVETTAWKHAAEALAASEAELRALFSSMEDVVIVLDREGRYLQVAPTNPARLKRPAAQLLGKRVDEVLSANEAVTIMSAVREALQQQEIIRVEYPLEINGADIWFEGSVSPIGADSVLWVARDITERKRDQEAMDEMHRQLKYLFDTLDEAFYSVDLENDRTLQISPAMERIFGRPVEDFYAHTKVWYEMVLPEDRPAVDAKLADMNAGEPTVVQYRIRRPDGAVRWVEAIIKPTLGNDGKLKRADGLCFDVTERRRSEEQLREQAALLDQARESITIRDLDGTIRFWNQGSARLYGYSPKEAVGRKVFELLKTQPEALVKTATRRVIEDGEWSGEMVHHHRSGTAVLVDSHWTLVRDDHGHPRAVFVISTDVTERRQLQAQLDHALKMESLGRLAGGIAHDFNNILGIILAHASLVETHLQQPDRVAHAADRIMTAADRGAGLVRQLLTFARKTESLFGPVNVNAVIDEAVTLLRHTLPRTIEIDVRTTAGLPNILADANQLHQVLVNLSVNARDAMPKGGHVMISTALVSADEISSYVQNAAAADHVRIEVQDTGIGMDEETKAHIFEPFFTTKEIGKGTGLGLATVFGIVRAHQGHIDVQSEPGAGSTFSLFFPVPRDSAGHAEQESHEASAPVHGSESILIVEDEEDLRSVTTSSLELHGYHVMKASDGGEGIRQYLDHRDRVDLIVTDLGMPKVDGPQMIRLVRESGGTVPIVVTSGIIEPEVRLELERLEVARILPKPFSAKALLRTVREVLDRTLPV